MLLSEALERMVGERRALNFSPATLYADRFTIGKLMQFLGDRPIDQVTLEDLRGYTGYRAKTVKPVTLAHEIRRLRSFFRWLVEEEYLVKSPAMKLREPKLPQRVPKALPFEALELVRDACKSPREHALIEFLFATGCRAGEVVGIKQSDVDWNRKAVLVMGKGSKEREVYFGARAALWLRRYLASRNDNCPYLFVAAIGKPRPTTAHQIWWTVKAVAARAGLRDRVWPHVMRHTLGTTLLNQGAPLVAVQSILGHTKPETTQLYAHLSGANRQQAYERYFVQ